MSAMIDMSLIKILSEGPSVSLKRLSTVSPTTAALCAARLREHVKRGDVVITMGAGEAYKVWDEISGRTHGARRGKTGSHGRTRF